MSCTPVGSTEKICSRDVLKKLSSPTIGPACGPRCARRQIRVAPMYPTPVSKVATGGHSNANSVDILGVRVDDVTYAEALGSLRQAIERRVPHVVTTPNPEFVMLARRDKAFQAVLNRAALNIPDGIGLVLAARLAGDRLRAHVQGTDLVLMLAAESARRGQRWFLLGGQGDVALRAGVRLAQQFPGLEVAGAMPGSP